MADHTRHKKTKTGYRLMLWTYAIQDLLGIDRPEPHVALVPLKAGMTVVDWACGPGRYTAALSAAVGPNGKVYAVDIEPLAIEAVERRIAKRRLANVTPLLTDGYSCPLESGSVDVVFLLDAFHAIDNRTALLREIRRVLKPEGLLFMDPGHMPLEAAAAAVTASGAFTATRKEGTHMFLTPA